MLSRLFSSREGGKPGRKGHRNKPSETSLRSRDEYNANRLQTAGADRELYQFDAPKQSLGMSDLIKQHMEGDQFLYAAVGGEQVEARDSRLRRLISYTPRLNKKAIPVEDLPAIKLYKETENFALSDIISRNKKFTKPYIRVASTIVQYGALTSVDSEFTKIILSIMDNRMLNSKMAKSSVFSSNIIAKMDFSLDYCFPKDEAESISLTVSRENRFMEEGHQWGVLKMELVLEEMDFPVQTANDPVVAMNQIPRTLMESRSVDPNAIDISITNSDRMKLAEIYMSGNMADVTEPTLNKTQTATYAKSSLAGPKGVKQVEQANSEWSFMNNKRSMIETDVNSIDISDDGSIKQEMSDRDSLNSNADEALSIMKAAMDGLKRETSNMKGKTGKAGVLKSALKKARFAGDEDSFAQEQTKELVSLQSRVEDLAQKVQGEAEDTLARQDHEGAHKAGDQLQEDIDKKNHNKQVSTEDVFIFN